MYELIYKCYRENGSYEYDIIILCRMKSMDEIIDNIVVKYNIPLEEEPIDSCYKDGFWIRELPEESLNEYTLKHYLEYYRNTRWKRK
jgi:hypothetical protein